MATKLKFHELPEVVQEAYHLYEIKWASENKGVIEITKPDDSKEHWKHEAGEGWVKINGKC